MTYKKLNNLIKRDGEINYITDSEVFFIENNININKYKNNKYILFEYTSNINNIIEILNNNNIKYILDSDELDMEFIII